MIHVVAAQEPPQFDRLVRQPGLKWLAGKGWAQDLPPPDASALPPFWRASQKELWQAYGGICAYLCIFFDWATGASSTDHFVAKSAHAAGAYDWSNYRLSCLGANRRKNCFDDVLDPFALPLQAFELNLVSGVVSAGAGAVERSMATAVDSTIERLSLNDPETVAMRSQHISDFLEGHVTADYLRRRSPFVCGELARQGYLD